MIEWKWDRKNYIFLAFSGGKFRRLILMQNNNTDWYVYYAIMLCVREGKFKITNGLISSVRSPIVQFIQVKFRWGKCTSWDWGHSEMHIYTVRIRYVLQLGKFNIWVKFKPGKFTSWDWEHFKGRLHLKPPKFEQNLNTYFPSFFCANTFDTSLLLLVCALRWYVKRLYRHLFFEDISKHARVTQKMALPNLLQT